MVVLGCGVRPELEQPGIRLLVEGKDGWIHRLAEEWAGGSVGAVARARTCRPDLVGARVDELRLGHPQPVALRPGEPTLAGQRGVKMNGGT
jgi:hypothetical protein